MDYLNAEHTGSDGAEAEDFLSDRGDNRHKSADLSRDRLHKLSSYFNPPPKLPEIPLTPEFPIHLVTTPRQLQALVQKLEGTSLFSTRYEDIWQEHSGGTCQSHSSIPAVIWAEFGTRSSARKG
ncbi:MAG: hypothetical protein ACO3XO_10055 [Bdellovibrionota bacterium]